MTRYLWALLAMLASATFFDGFDAAILATVAPFVQQQYGLDDRAWGSSSASRGSARWSRSSC